jgi:LysR family transcriptional regulator (chromosome initiation inhibitor)
MDVAPAQLAALSAVIAEGTFDAAARRLHVTPSAISQRLKALETSVGRVLVTRSKPVRATPAGEVMLRLARQFEVLSADALAEVDAVSGSPDAPTTVTLAVNEDSLASWFPAALVAVGPGFVFDVHGDDQERTVQWLRNGTVMAAVTPVAEPVPGCSAHRLGRMRYHAVAEDSFARRWFPDGPTTDRLQFAPMVCYDRADQVADRYLRTRTRRRVTAPRHYVPNTSAYLRAIVGGLGWGMLHESELESLPTRPRILDPDRTVDVTLYWQQWRLRSTALDAVAAAVRTTAAAVLD